MATRFYLPSSGAAAVSPGYNAGWESTSIAARLKAVTTKIGSAMTTVSYDDANTSNQDILFRQYVSDPIAAQTLSAQTVKLQMRVSETDSVNNLGLTWAMYVFTGDGATLRGTILAIRKDAVEAATSLTDRGDSTTSSEVEASAGDRIVIEIGMSGDPAASGSHDSSISIGDDSGTDLPANDTETAAYNPWVEFANTITFASTTITGAAAITLDTIGTSVAGAVGIAAAAAVTLGGIVLSAAGTVAIAGASAITLDGIGLSAAGTVGVVEVTAEAAITLDGITLSATGAVSISGAGSITLDGIAISSSGAVGVVGNASITLSGISITASGNASVSGHFGASLGTIGLSASGAVGISGAASHQLDDISITADGTVAGDESAVAGSAEITLSGVTLSADGVVYTIVGAFDLTLHSRSTALTLDTRPTALTLADRSTALTLDDRSAALTVYDRSQALTLEEP